MGPLMAAAHPDAFTLAHHPRLRCASGAHRIDGVGKPLALALHMRFRRAISRLIVGHYEREGEISHLERHET
jgi:hypothetical protein